MEINNHHLCIGCMHELHSKEVCPYCGLEQRSYTSIPRCLIMGTRLADRYVLGKVLGEGSFGITYIGWDTLLEIPVAIKEYYPSDLVSRDVVRGNDTSVYLFSGIEKEEYEKRLERFLKEARNLTRFNQLPSIVSVRDFFYANNTAYIVMDYIEGESLKTYIKRQGAMDAKEVLNVFRPILESLEKMHVTGIIHRDISPDNLLFDENHNLVLIDFGAAELQNAELTRTVTITFKRGFSPEEQYRSHGRQGPWTDIYALCASMYYAMTGVAPDEAIQRTIEDKVEPLWDKPDIGITKEQSRAIMKGMSVHGEDRFQSVAALYQQLYRENIDTAVNGNRGRHAGKEQRNIPVKRILCICMILLLVAGIIGGSAGYRIWSRSKNRKYEDPGMQVTEQITGNDPDIQDDGTKEVRNVMPSCVGHTKEEIMSMLSVIKYSTFHIEWKEQYSENDIAGRVIQQSIPEGTELETGKEYELSLTISVSEDTAQPTDKTMQADSQSTTQATDGTTQAESQTSTQITDGTTQSTGNTVQATTQAATTAKKSKKSSTKKKDNLDGFIQ